MLRSTNRLLLACLVLWAASGVSAAADRTVKTRTKKIILIAGRKSHGPGHHEYEKGLRLVKACLDSSPNLKGLSVELHLNGWPQDPTTLETADTIVMFCDGADHSERAHPLLSGDRLAMIEKQMKRGCGFVALHYTVFVPNRRGGQQFLNWIGGYFDYQSGSGPRKWYSKIRTATTTPRPATPAHPICRGLKPFKLREEYYYHIRFRDKDPRRTPILTTSIPGEKTDQVVAWAVQRKEGGRGFGFTGGHFHDNWKVAPFRRMILNAIVWTAGMKVPPGGVRSALPSEKQLSDVAVGRPIRALIVTGHQYPGHKWRQTTPAISAALRGDLRMQVTVVNNVEFLADPRLRNYDVMVLNYCNWKRPGLSDAAKAGFVRYLKSGGGLVIVHFANGAFHYSLPGAGKSDWPEYRKICRRVWDHTKDPKTGRMKSAHDPYGKFRVNIADAKHPVTRGMQPFETSDELYFHQQGTLPIHVVATAHSHMTGHDEPIAFVYDYGRARVFQTVLGHDAASLRVSGTAALIRRGAVWTAGRKPRPLSEKTLVSKRLSVETLVKGRFGKALDARVAVAEVTHQSAYAKLPISVECWTRLHSKARYNILVASGPKASGDHWEIFSETGTGKFSAYLPGFSPALIRSGTDITDDRLHYVAMTCDGRHVKLYIDARLVAEKTVHRIRRGGPVGSLWFGAYPQGSLGCDGVIDEVRLSDTVRRINQIPQAPFRPDAHTIGLWHLDATVAKRLRDASSTNNPALLRQPGRAAPSVLKVTYRLADSDLKIVKIDHSPDDSFLSIRADSAGRLFVGCREALFVYEPDNRGGYHPRKLLYRFPPDSWINDLEIRGDDLYCMTSAALYLFPRGRVARRDLKPRRLIWGSPVDLHVTYHGLAWGPQGDLYFTSGDPLLTYGDFAHQPDHWGHWTVFTQPTGTQVPYTGTGGFFHCRPDGSRFRVVAQGTRGSFGLVFDRSWNLFSNDNDHESIPSRYVPGRLLYAAPKANFFWPRGWMARKTPRRADLLKTVTAGLGRAVLVGQSYYDESFLPKKYRHNLLVARWGQRRLNRYVLTRRGAGFEAKEFPLLIGGGAARPVGVAVGRGGRLFVTVSHMAGNAYSPKYPSDLIMITRRDDPPAHPFDPYEATTADPSRLWQELASDSWWRRQRAHLEIARRGGKLLDEAVSRLQRSSSQDGTINHLLWLAGLSGSSRAAQAVRAFADNPDPSERRQAIRVLSEMPKLRAPRKLFVKALADRDPGVRHTALISLFNSSGPLPDEVARGPGRSRDSYLRQTAAFLLAEQGAIEQIRRLCTTDDVPGRMLGILAAGFQLTVPPADDRPPAELPLTIRRTGAVWDAKTVVQYANEKIDLSKFERIGSYTTAERWNKVKHTPQQEQLFRLLVDRLSDPNDGNRFQAAYFLSLLNDARSRPLLAKVRSEDLARRLASTPFRPVQNLWRIGPFSTKRTGLPESHAIESGPIDLSAGHPGIHKTLHWTKQTAANGRFGLRVEADKRSRFYFLFRLQSFAPVRAELTASTFNKVRIWHNGRPVPRGTTAQLELQPGSNNILMRVDAANSASTLSLQYRATGQVEAVLPENLGSASLAARLKSATAKGGRLPDMRKFLDVNWNKAVSEGNAERGRKLFSVDGLACVKCHGDLKGRSGRGAPSLADAGKRFTVPYLVESILLPSKRVATLFRATLLVTEAGKTITGLVVEENKQQLVLLLPNGTKQTVRKDKIEMRKIQSVSPMPVGLVKTPEELRDLLAYLCRK